MHCKTNMKLAAHSNVAVLFVVSTSCSTISTVQTGSYKYHSDYDSRDLHPEYTVYHFSDDSSTVLFRVRSSELLYARASGQAPFIAQLGIRCVISNSDYTVVDTTKLNITDQAKGKQGWL